MRGNDRISVQSGQTVEGGRTNLLQPYTRDGNNFIRKGKGNTMMFRNKFAEMLTELDAEIAELTEARNHIAKLAPRGPGRPRGKGVRKNAPKKGTRALSTKGSSAGTGAKKRKLSAKGRANIAKAARKRWAQYNAQKAAADKA